MKLQFADTEDVALAKKKILELIELLPTTEQFDFDNFMMGISLRDEYAELMRRDDGSDIKIGAAVSRLEKKLKGFDDMIKLNERMKELKKTLSPEDFEKINLQGSGLRARTRKQIKTKFDEELAEYPKDQQPTDPENSTGGQNVNLL